MRRMFVKGIFWIVIILAQSSVNSAGPLKAEQPIYVVSMVRLLMDPGDYIGERVRVFGYLHIGASIHLFLTEAHATGSDDASSIVVGDHREHSIFDSECASGYHTVYGKLFRIEPAVILLAPDEVVDSRTHEACWALE